MQLRGGLVLLTLLAHGSWAQLAAGAAPAAPGVVVGKRLHIGDTPELLADDAVLPPGASLRMVHAIFRNGARTPLSEQYVPGNQQWRNCDVGLKGINMQFRTSTRTELHKDMARLGGRGNRSRCGHGRLTEVGYAEAYSLGVWMRKRYLDTPQPMVDAIMGYDRGVRAQSTQFSLPLSTLHGVLSGLIQRKKLEAPLDVPVHVPKASAEVLLANLQSCPRLGHLAKLADLQTHEKNTGGRNADTARDSAQLLRKFVKLPARDDSGWVSWKRLLDAVMCMEAHNMTLFPGLDDHIYNLIDVEATKRVAAVLAPPCPTGFGLCQQLLQLAMGPLLSQVVTGMQALVECLRQGPVAAEAFAAVGDEEGEAARACRQRVHLLSGHDTTLLPLLSILGHPVQRWPAFLSNVIFELWEIPAGIMAEPRPVALDNPLLGHDIFADEEGVRPTVSQASIGAATTFAVRILHDFKPLHIGQAPGKEEAASAPAAARRLQARGAAGSSRRALTASKAKGVQAVANVSAAALPLPSSLLLLRSLSDVVLLPYLIRPDDYRTVCARPLAAAAAAAALAPVAASAAASSSATAAAGGKTTATGGRRGEKRKAEGVASEVGARTPRVKGAAVAQVKGTAATKGGKDVLFLEDK